MNARGALNIDCPLDVEFYNHLTGKRASFTRVSDFMIPPGEGYGFRVAAGHTFRLTTTERVQLADLCVYNSEDIRERFDSGTQIAMEGNAVGRLTRIWGNPPRSRPLCTVIADTLRERSSEHHLHEHHAHGAHCNPHHWELFDHAHPHTCYDNLRKGLSMLGLGQTEIHDNINLWSKKAWNPYTGHAVGAMGDAEPGDCIEFYAEIDLQLAISLCPYGDGAVNPDAWAGAQIPLYPLRLEVFSTGVAPREWTFTSGT